jgi:hypothetical protein
MLTAASRTAATIAEVVTADGVHAASEANAVSTCTASTSVWPGALGGARGGGGGPPGGEGGDGGGGGGAGVADMPATTILLTTPPTTSSTHAIPNTMVRVPSPPLDSLDGVGGT